MMRPRPARWFEVLCARADVSLLLEALGATGAVELEARAGVAMPAEWAALAPGLAEFHGLKAHCGAFWPGPGRASRGCPESPQRVLAVALDAVRAWCRECEAAITALQLDAARRGEIELWRAAIRAWASVADPPAGWHAPGALIGSWLVDPGSSGIDLSTQGLARELPLEDGRSVWMLLGRREAIAAIEAQIHAGHGQLLPAPAWLPREAGDVDAVAAAQLAALQQADERHRQQLRAAAERLRLPEALADLLRLDWIARSVRALATTELLAFISGWSCDPDGALIERAVADSGARALLHYPPPPAELTPPLLLNNPRWARPFEVFSRAFGVPGRNEADPTTVVAVVAPLLFGYMFGDVGQGAVIALAGYALQRRSPFGRLLLSAGIASMAFGWVYGSVFAREDVLAPLWLRPLQQPLPVLAVPLVAGAILLLVGLALNALGAWWRGRIGEWWLHDAGGVLVYVGLLCAPWDRRGLWLAAAGALWTVLASLAHRRALLPLAAALGGLLERSVQLLVNTLSFARVGAFALAHAGLSSAVVALADASGGGASALLVLVVGNALILALEAMVVSIQTTRLVLFEFFTRFLTGAGRVFVPLPPPPSMTGEV